jgi:hypothetical protein
MIICRQRFRSVFHFQKLHTNKEVYLLAESFLSVMSSHRRVVAVSQLKTIIVSGFKKSKLTVMKE